MSRPTCAGEPRRHPDRTLALRSAAAAGSRSGCGSGSRTAPEASRASAAAKSRARFLPDHDRHQVQIVNDRRRRDLRVAPAPWHPHRRTPRQQTPCLAAGGIAQCHRPQRHSPSPRGASTGRTIRLPIRPGLALVPGPGRQIARHLRRRRIAAMPARLDPCRPWSTASLLGPGSTSVAGTVSHRGPACMAPHRAASRRPSPSSRRAQENPDCSSPRSASPIPSTTCPVEAGRNAGRHPTHLGRSSGLSRPIISPGLRSHDGRGQGACSAGGEACPWRPSRQAVDPGCEDGHRRRLQPPARLRPTGGPWVDGHQLVVSRHRPEA